MSGQKHLCFMVAAAHLLMLKYHIHVWFEYVMSDDNWSDGISRDGFSDKFIESIGCNRSWVDLSPLFWPHEAYALNCHIQYLH